VIPWNNIPLSISAAIARLIDSSDNQYTRFPAFFNIKGGYDVVIAGAWFV
jgi:hypothetical protein